jgi:protein-L-isoaspartate(D-aspartate) O-methyltransferase
MVSSGLSVPKHFRRDLIKRGITSRVVDAFTQIPRESFVPDHLRGHAYDDRPLPIGFGQTISQPYIVALMMQSLEIGPEHRILEIGTGSGYEAALLATMCRTLYTVERIPQLLDRAKGIISQLALGNVETRLGDGTLGWPEEAPFDRIIVSAAGPAIPDSLMAQLADPGRLVIPVGPPHDQDLLLLLKSGDRISKQHLCKCAFVRLVGDEGFGEE